MRIEVRLEAIIRLRLIAFLSLVEGAEAVRRAREKAYWESNDYYSSDEDTFLDRTGDVEARRRKRMRRFGVEPQGGESDSEKGKAEEAEDSFAVVSCARGHWGTPSLPPPADLYPHLSCGVVWVCWDLSRLFYSSL